MLPNTLLRTAQGNPMLVEFKNGETYHGHLVNCDRWMNIHLRGVVCKHGDKSWRMAECYIHGNTINCLRVPDKVIDKVQEETNKNLTDRKRREMDDVSGGRPTKSMGMGRGQDVGGAIGFGGGGQGRGGTHNRRGGGGGRGGQII